MKRRDFLQSTIITAVAVSAYGFIYLEGERYVSDCATTSDILGPFYRPGSPIKNNLLIEGKPGQPVVLSGSIMHKDCTTPFNKAKVELWHCDGNGVYDNDSDEFRYRGTTFSDEKGNYSFKTVIPVPYNVGNGNVRPAHFHMMITAEGYQPLVTQVYFSGDKNIKTDRLASSPQAKNRILDVQNMKDGSKKVVFNISLSKTLPGENAAIDGNNKLHVL